MTYTLELIIKGTFPTYLATGQTFNISHLNAFMNIPPDTFELFVRAFNVSTSHSYLLSTKFSDFDLLWTNVQPSTFNIESQVDVGFLAFVDGSVVLTGIPLLSQNPVTGVVRDNFTVGPFTAGGGEAGDVASLNVGQLKGSLNVVEANGPGVTQFSGSCGLHAPVELIA